MRRFEVAVEILIAVKIEPFEEGGYLATGDKWPGEGVTDDSRRFA